MCLLYFKNYLIRFTFATYVILIASQRKVFTETLKRLF